MNRQIISKIKKSPVSKSAGFFFVYLVVMVIRSWSLRDRIRVEDGTFIQYFFDQGPSSFLMVLGGYRQIPSHVVSALVSFLPPSFWSLSFWLLSSAIWVSLASAIQQVFLSITRSYLAASLAGLAVVINGPASSDALGNTISTSYIAIGVLLVLFCVGKYKTRGWICCGLFAFVLSLQMPLAALCLPIIFARILLRTLRPIIGAAILLTVSSTFLISLLTYSAQSDRKSRIDTGLRLGDFTWEVMLSANRQTSWLRLPLSQDFRFKLFFILLSIALVGTFWRFSKPLLRIKNSRLSSELNEFETMPRKLSQSRSEQVVLLTYSFIAVQITYYLTSGIQDRHQVTGAFLLIAILILVSIDSIEHKKLFQKIVGMVLLLVVFIGNIKEFVPSSYSNSGPRWSGELKSATEKCNTDPLLQDIIMQISPIAPPGIWIIKMKCERLRG